MAPIFCCNDIAPYKAARILHENLFTGFMAWARSCGDVSVDTTAADAAFGGGGNSDGSTTPPFAIQLVRQVNYGPIESKRYFVPVDAGRTKFIEVTEDALIQANFQKLNAYKNYRCSGDNRFFELNVYQKDPHNAHHWRNNLARPASNIDL